MLNALDSDSGYCCWLTFLNLDFSKRLYRDFSSSFIYRPFIELADITLVSPFLDRSIDCFIMNSVCYGAFSFLFTWLYPLASFLIGVLS
jgi:hypothetical protein